MRNSLKLLFLVALTAQAQNFDYYLFTLSWSPEYCHGHPGAVECTDGRHHGFIVHGLWPQYNNGRYPENCSTQPAPQNPPQVAQIMPDPGLVAHEWATHGTCSGLSPDQYFTLIRRTWDSFKIPLLFQAPSRTQTLSPADVKQAFEQANPQLNDEEIAVNCPQNYLSGIQICVSKSGAPIPCPGNTVRDCRARSIRVPPVK